MSQGMTKRPNVVIGLEAEEGLDESLLDGISGGVSFGKVSSEPGNAETGQAHDAAPEFSVDGDTARTGAGAGAGVSNGTAKASAGASAGHEITADLGNGVTAYNRYLVSAQVQTYAGPMGAGAGATVGVGAEAGLKLGDHVEVSAGVSATASAGAAIGVHNYTLVGQASADVDVNIHSKGTVTSPEFGNGAKVTTTASAQMGYGAEAGGSATLGAGGAYTDFKVGAGSYASIEGEGTVGNSTATGGVSGGLISPGSLSAGVTGGATFDSGKLSLGLENELSIGIAGAKFGVKLELQLFDNTHKRGTDEEIAEMEKTINSFAKTTNDMLTAQWRSGLASDVKSTESDLKTAQNSYVAAQNAMAEYDKKVANDYTRLTNAITTAAANVELYKAFGANPTTAHLYTSKQDELQAAKKELSNWEALMGSHFEAETRKQMSETLLLAKSAVDLNQDLNNAAKTRFAVSQQMSYLAATAMAESTVNEALVQVGDAAAERQKREDIYNNAQSWLAKEELKYSTSKAVYEQEKLSLTTRMGAGENVTSDMKRVDAHLRSLDKHLSDLEPSRKTVAGYKDDLDKATKNLNDLAIQSEIVKRQMTVLHPIWSAQAAVDEGKKLTSAVVTTFAERAQSGSVTPFAEMQMKQSLHMAEKMTNLFTDNIKMSATFDSTLSDVKKSFMHEYDHLNEMVTDRGIFSAIASLFG